MKFWQLYQEGCYDDWPVMGPCFSTEELAIAHALILNEGLPAYEQWEIQEDKVLDTTPVRVTTYTLMVAYDINGQEVGRTVTTMEDWDYNSPNSGAQSQLMSFEAISIYAFGRTLEEAEQFAIAKKRQALSELAAYIKRAKRKAAK